MPPVLPHGSALRQDQPAENNGDGSMTEEEIKEILEEDSFYSGNGKSNSKTSFNLSNSKEKREQDSLFISLIKDIDDKDEMK